MPLVVTMLPHKSIYYITEKPMPGLENIPLNHWSEESKRFAEQCRLLLLALFVSQDATHFRLRT